ncbi:MAG: hypothetical protein WAL97_00755 [Halobacteriota archaeon]
MQAFHPQTITTYKKQAMYNLFAAYIHTMPLEELIESVEQARLDAKLRFVVIYGAACSYCLSRAKRLEGSYLRTFALELREQLAHTLAAFVTSFLTQQRRRLDAASAAEPPLRQIIDVLQQVMCTHDAEKLAISVLPRVAEQRLACPVICPPGDTLPKGVKIATFIADHSAFQADEEYLGAGGTNCCRSYSFGWMHLFCKRTV